MTVILNPQIEQRNDHCCPSRADAYASILARSVPKPAPVAPTL